MSANPASQIMTAAAAYEKTKTRVAELQALGDQFDEAVANAVIGYVSAQIEQAIDNGLASASVEYGHLYTACADNFKSAGVSTNDIKQMTIRRFRSRFHHYSDCGNYITLGILCERDHGRLLAEKYEHFFTTAGYVVWHGSRDSDTYTITWIQK